MSDQATRNEEERENYYSALYDKVLDELKHIRGDQESILKTLDKHDQHFENIDQRFENIDQRFQTLEGKVDATKAASETAHEEILKRLERIESRLE